MYVLYLACFLFPYSVPPSLFPTSKLRCANVHSVILLFPLRFFSFFYISAKKKKDEEKQENYIRKEQKGKKNNIQDVKKKY
ncbi:hypothetical protein STCU_11911 [Strigomonas culicis]|uniref:Uncharacterized protein n=1 Tax=Strigomonas culicis TaxID=28005 RepID=S9UYI8_9TRYP|nr:hypothetical protein STCU_11911 [Strigomonas culicis]|eukprot:EPY15585.1 hypothetical protein STCU_11911 [Strigomonas culicis]